MAKHPSTKVDARQAMHTPNNPSHQTKKRPPVLRYRKKIMDPTPEPQQNRDNQLEDLDDSSSSTHDNQSSLNVQDFLFHPRHIVIEQHSTIRWRIPTNSTTVHSIAIDNVTKKKGTGRTLCRGTPTFEHTFDTLGSVRYSCSLYSFMAGTVTVVASLTPEQISQNVVFLDYPSHQVKKSPSKAPSPTIFPFHKQLVMWREKQPKSQVSMEDEDTFAHQSRQRIKKAAAVKVPSPSVSADSSPHLSIAAVPIPSRPSRRSNALYVFPLSPSSSVASGHSHHVVHIQNFEFSALENVTVGDSVAWKVSTENPGMVEHALKMRVMDPSNTIVQTTTSPPLKPGDSWEFTLLQPCKLFVECVVYDLKSPTILVEPSVPATERPNDNVILIGDVACPVARESLARGKTFATCEVNEPSPDSADSILHLLHMSTLKQQAMRSSYVVEHGRGIPGFDAAATYDLLKQRTPSKSNEYVADGIFCRIAPRETTATRCLCM
ncbi:hypothetical protein DYB32_001690 [Aphanomyces invadans]|uniref:Uncharacterized protein n=1 Tax=Aphanomyces invadans TaxID=157072 RepID=A0A3R6VRL5_9STRA|nr:hypothetical protein DYB32_001690 [Aphanomyces invadans]